MTENEDEVDDYMSDSFLVECKETKPGQLTKGRVARQYKQEAKHKEANARNQSKFKPVKQREEEQRQKGLSSAISTQSKGFALLQKMGYKQGSGLGKTGSGRAEPVPIEVKTDRGGLGRGTELKRRQEEVEKMREVMAHKRVKMESRFRGQFRQHMSNKFTEKEVEKDLYSSQRACEHLDVAQGYHEPEVSWYWPKKLEPSTEEEEEEEEDVEEDEEKEKEDEEEEEELPAVDKLFELTRYLRSQHKYCVWCGTAFNDDQDLEDNCPGDDADAHR